MSTPTAFASIGELAGQLRSGETNPSELMECYAARIERLNETSKAYISLDIDRARTLADCTQPEPGDSLLKGIPYSCKDLFDVKGLDRYFN